MSFSETNKFIIFPLGENAATVDFGNQISTESNDLVLALARHFSENPFDGLIETVPAYSSLTVFYDVFKIRRNNLNVATVFDFVREKIRNALLEIDANQNVARRLVEIPVCFDQEFAPDLDFVAAENNLSPPEAIGIFLSRTYRVFMLGFLPGFSYMGEIDEQIATARKHSPRLRVPAGSVGIAGRQTGIYSLESPGGWQIIGRTPLKMFDLNREPPTVLQAGDDVKFYQIDARQFAALKQNQSEIRYPISEIE